MKPMVSFLAVAVLALLSAHPSVARAQEPAVPTAAELQQAERAAPVIPHRVGQWSEAKECLSCHGINTKGVPISPHPVRLACTQCHVPKEFSAPPAGKPARKKR